MFEQRMTTDANGFALFSPRVVMRALGRSVLPGENLLLAFKQSALGDEVLARGAVVPIYPVTDGTYDVCVRLATESRASFSKAKPDAEAGIYVLHVVERVILGDLAVLQEWLPEIGWNVVSVAPGYYTARVFAYRSAPCSGFEIVLTPVAQLQVVTADWDTSLDVDGLGV